MFLSGMVLALLLAGCWLYCLTDAACTPSAEFPGMRKCAWVTFIALTFVLGATTWLLMRASRRRNRRRGRSTGAGRGGTVTPHPYRPGFGPGQAGDGCPTPGATRSGRHPAGRARKAALPAPMTTVGPDDDPEFLQLLDRLIRDKRDHGE
jgi:hypothetical protein